MAGESERAGRVLLILVLGAIALGVGVALAVARNVTGPVSKLTTQIRRLAQGDLSNRIEITATHEVGEMARDLNAFIEQLEGIIGEVRTASDSLSAVADQVTSTSQALSQGTGEHAASVEHTTALARGDERVHHPERGEQPLDASRWRAPARATPRRAARRSARPWRR